MENQIRALVSGHIVTIKSELKRVSELCRADPLDFDELAGLTHKLKGSAGTVGFLPISESLQALNDFFSEPANVGADIPENCREHLRKLHDLAANLKLEDSSLLAKFTGS